MEDWRGQLIEGYRIRERLDEDNLGVVYRAFHPVERTDVAFRVFANTLSQQKEFLAQFQELATRLTKLDHPGIVRTIGQGTWHGQLFLMMAYASGPTLRQVLEHTDGPLPWADVVQLGRQIADALQYVHGHQLLHLAMRPKNVQLVRHDQAYQATLKEVGIGRLLESSFQANSDLQTREALTFLSPEQCVASPATVKTDVYSAGVVLYELSTGQPPFQVSSVEQAVAMHTKAVPKNPSQHRIDTPAELANLVLAMIAKDPRKRPSVEEVAEQLQNLRRQLKLPHGSGWEALAGAVSLAQPQADKSDAALSSPDLSRRPTGTLELHISRPGESTRIVPLQIPQRLVIGRDAKCDLPLPDSRVSRHHAELLVQPSDVVIQDLGSANGTFIGDARLLPRQPETLSPGSAIRIPPFELRLESVGQPEPVPAAAAEQAAVASPGPASTVNVRMEDGRVRATPGSTPGVLQVNLQNMTSIVDHFSVRVFGVPPDWVTCPVRPVQLNPRQQAPITLTVHPPPEPTTPAGPHPIQLLIHSRERKDVVEKVDAVLVVEPFARFDAELAPADVETRTRGALEVTITNQGNAPSEYTVAAKDSAQALMCQVEPERVELAPAASQAVKLRVAPRKLNWLGGTKMMPLIVTVTSSTAPPRVLPAQFRLRAWLPSWLPVLLMVLCCALAGLAAAVGPGLYDRAFPSPTPTASGTPSQTPVSTATPTPSLTPTSTPNATATWGALDSDGDGLSNADEINIYRTDPYKYDTDADGLSDGDEVYKYKTDPLDNDTDNDTWLDGEEVALSLQLFGEGPILCPNPNNPDSDFDGIVDRLDPDPCNLPTATPSVTPTTTPVPNFGLGGQIRGNDHLGEMRQAGMTWVKKQIRYGPGDSALNLAEDINTWHTQGFKVLLSVVGHREDLAGGSGYFDQYAAFVGGLAELQVEAIEVWNEMNIDREWPTGQISPNQYVDLLAKASSQIRSRGVGTLVISGAPAPTGVDDGVQVWSDKRYVEGMASAGADRFIDCVGIHYNEGIIPPDETSGDPRSEHYTRYFWGMVDTYWNAFGGKKPLCLTELGYLSPEGYGQLPSNFAWAQDTSVYEQAEWLGQAVSLAAASGKVRMAIIWNVDFEVFGDDPQAGYAIIRKDGSCPACAILKASVPRNP
jgi:serine/threonine protein kinase